MGRFETKVAREATALLMCSSIFWQKLSIKAVLLTHYIHYAAVFMQASCSPVQCAKSFLQRILLTTHNFSLRADGLTKNFGSSGSNGP